MDFSAFASSLKSSTAAVYLFCGEEAHFREQGAALLKPRAPGGVLRIPSSEADWPRLLDELYTPSLLGGTKLVVLSDDGNFIHNHSKEVAEYLKAPSTVAILAAMIPGKTPAVSGKNVAIVECRSLKPLDLARWVAAEFQRRGKTAEKAAIQLLIDRGGSELSGLGRSIETLVDYLGKRPILSAEDVRAVVADNGTHEIYELAIAAASKKPGRALEIAHKLLAGREAPQQILWKLAWQYRKLVEARKLLDSGVPSIDITSRLQITFYTDEFIRLVRAHTVPELLAKHAKILETDLALKSASASDLILLEKLVCELSSESVLVT